MGITLKTMMSDELRLQAFGAHCIFRSASIIDGILVPC